MNYETLYNIVLSQMKEPAHLLEHIGQRVIEEVLQNFPKFRKVKVNIYKFNLPLGGICHRAKVTLEEAVG